MKFMCINTHDYFGRVGIIQNILMINKIKKEN